MKIKALLYCTKARPYLRKSIKDKDYYLDNGSKYNIIPKEDYSLNDKIVAECDFEVEEISSVFFHAGYNHSIIYDCVEFKTNTISELKLEMRSCVDYEEMCKYLGYYEEDKEKVGYAIHIKNLHIFDSPHFLEGYDDSEGHTLRKTPKNMCKAKLDGKPYVLISVKSQEMCRIANKEQTTLVRRNVLKEMLK